MNPVAPVSATFIAGQPPVLVVRATCRPRRGRQLGPHRGRRLPGPSALWSGVDRSADAEPAVEAQRLHDGERGGPGGSARSRAGLRRRWRRRLVMAQWSPWNLGARALAAVRAFATAPGS